MRLPLGHLAANFPDFLIVGAAKSGTTILHSWLAENKHIYGSFPKELWFWHQVSNPNQGIYDVWPRKRIPQNILEYLSYFEGASSEQLCCESSPSYLYFHEHAISNLKKYHPRWNELKIIIVLREPIDRILSQHRFVLQHGYDPESLPINKALAEEPRRLKENKVVPGCFYTALSLYLSQVKVYNETFENVCFLEYDMFKKEPGFVVDKVCDFLGCPSHSKEVNFAKKVNASEAYVMDRFNGSRRFYKGIDKSVSSIFGRRGSEALRSMGLRRLFFSKPEKITPENEKMLAEKFCKEIPELEEITKLDLSSWQEKYESIIG